METEKNGNTIPSPVKAIRAKCLDCCYDQKDEVRLCPSTTCPLWPYRIGKNPNRTRTMTDEQRKAAAERLAKVRRLKKGE